MEEYFEINRLVWVFFKRYLDAVKEDVTAEGWQKIYADAETICDKYPCQYCKDLVFAQLTELEDVCRKNNGIKKF